LGTVALVQYVVFRVCGLHNYSKNII